MSIIKKVIFLSVFITIISAANSFAEDIKKVGKFKDWEVMVMSEALSTGEEEWLKMVEEETIEIQMFTDSLWVLKGL